MWLNANSSNSCVICSKQDVCKYKDEYIEFKDKVRSIKVNASLAEVAVTCKHFAPCTQSTRTL